MPDFKSKPVPNEVLHQIGIDLCNLPEIDGFRHLIVYIISLNGLKQKLSLTGQHQFSKFFCTR